MYADAVVWSPHMCFAQEGTLRAEWNQIEQIAFNLDTILTSFLLGNILTRKHFDRFGRCQASSYSLQLLQLCCSSVAKECSRKQNSVSSLALRNEL